MIDSSMVAINIGDLTNNWIGRLMSKYADQETTRQQAIKLIEWYLGSSGVYWAGVVGGNHDFWGHEHGNVLDFIMRSLFYCSLMVILGYFFNIRPFKYNFIFFLAAFLNFYPIY